LLGDGKLRLIAHELLVSLRENVAVDWAHRESATARLRILIVSAGVILTHMYQISIAVDTRMVVGWSMKPTLARELVLDALLMAMWRRKPRQSVIVHSDQGAQYGSDDWQGFCQAHRLQPSMSRRDNCWDNAVAESFFSSLKKERIRKRVYKTRDLAKADVFDYIEVVYNKTRRHSYLSGVSPEAFERASA